MKFSKLMRAAFVGTAVFGLAAGNALAAEETLRSLAEERGRYIGAILNSEWFNNGLGGDAAAYEQIHSGQFNAVVAENEMKFDATEPNRNQFNYTKGDKLVTYAKQNGMRVRGHALAWHSQVPGWVSNGNFSKQELLGILKNHIDSVVTHYKGDVHEWDVVNEAINDDNNHGWRSQGSIWYQTIGPEFIDSAFVWAHAADPDAELCYNDYAIEWGTNSGSKAGFLLEQVDKWLAAGIPITCIGTQTHIEDAHTSTPQNIRNLAKELKKRGLRLNITELDIGFPNGKKGQLTAADYAAQGHLYRQFMDVFLEADNMGEFMIWGVSDKYSWLDTQQGKFDGLIYDREFNKKPAYDSLMASLKAHSVESVKPAGYGQEITFDPDAGGTTTFGKGSYVIVDYATDPATRGSWDGDVEAGKPAFVSVTEGYSLPMAGCDQNDCGYQHAIYTLPDDVVSKKVLSLCENLMVTMKTAADSTEYVNIGFSEPWKSLQYGNAAKLGEFAAVSVPLDSVRANDAEPTQLTFNSNGKGFNLLKIEAVGCPDDMSRDGSASAVDPSVDPSAIKTVAATTLNFSVAGKLLVVNATADVSLFDMQGRPVFSARNVRSAVNLANIPNGNYIVRMSNGSQNLIRRVVLK